LAGFLVVVVIIIADRERSVVGSHDGGMVRRCGASEKDRGDISKSFWPKEATIWDENWLQPKAVAAFLQLEGDED
jgi:hypothetical protein